MILPEDIKLVNQVDDSTCHHATLSMVTGVPIQEIIDEYGIGGKKEDEKDGISERDAIRFLMKHMILPVQMPELINPFYLYGVFKISVPSLNRPGRLHSLIVASHPKTGYTVFDPQNGREGKKWYPLDAMQPDGGTPRVSYVNILKLEDMSY